MIYHGLILTGTSGAGKTTITRELTRSGIFKQVKSVTTRAQRDDDNGEYEYVTKAKFKTAKFRENLMIKAEYRDEFYGITFSAIQESIDTGKVPILVITPAAAAENTNKPNQYNFMSLFIDAPNDELDKRILSRGEEITVAVKEQRLKDREHKDANLYYIQNFFLDKTCDLIKTLWEYRSSGGVLSKRIIQLMLDCGMLLKNADNENVKGASYDLCLGDEYYYKGKIDYLDEKKPFLMIEPYDYVVATSKELTNFPRDISGRFDLSVSLFCQGIILSNGPCVDPGFRGRLFCLLFNTSNAPVVLKRGQHYSTLEVNKLIEPTGTYNGKYQDKETIINYLPSNALQGGINELKKEVESLGRRNEFLQTAVAGSIAIFLAVLSILLTIK